MRKRNMNLQMGICEKMVLGLNLLKYLRHVLCEGATKETAENDDLRQDHQHTNVSCMSTSLHEVSNLQRKSVPPAAGIRENKKKGSRPSTLAQAGHDECGWQEFSILERYGGESGQSPRRLTHCGANNVLNNGLRDVRKEHYPI